MVLVTLMSIALVACSSEKEEQKLTIENFDLVDTYQYDKVKVVVEDEKTPEELAYEVLMDTLGLTSDQQDSYKEVGISDTNGVFVNAGILEGSNIPNVSGFSAEQAAMLDNEKDKSESMKIEEFQKLQESRERKVSVYDEEKSLEDTKKRIERAAKEQEIRIQEQQKEAQEQQKGKGNPEFNVE